MSGSVGRVLSIAESFSLAPAGRYRDDGPYSGQGFRDDVLEPALLAGPVRLIFDGVASLPSSFLEEALGGLIRKGWSLSQIQERLEIVAETPRMQTYKPQALGYIRDAAYRAEHANRTSK